MGVSLVLWVTLLVVATAPLLTNQSYNVPSERSVSCFASLAMSQAPRMLPSFRCDTMFGSGIPLFDESPNLQEG